MVQEDSLGASRLDATAVSFRTLKKDTHTRNTTGPSICPPASLSVLGLLHHLHHHRPGPRQDQEADGPVVQVQDVEPVDGNQELTNLQAKKRRSEEKGPPG